MYLSYYSSIFIPKISPKSNYIKKDFTSIKINVKKNNIFKLKSIYQVI